MTDINIAYASTKDWFQYTMTSIASVLFNAKDSDTYSFHILSNEFSNEDKQHFKILNKIKKSEFHFYKMEDSDFNDFYKNPIGNSTNYRLKLTNITNLDKILYLDTDTLIRRDIADLYNTDISDYYIAGIEDKCGKIMAKRIAKRESFTYINGGVLLMNLTEFRKNLIDEKLFTYMKNTKHLGTTDQDAINATCINHIKYLPLKYNFMESSCSNTTYDKTEFEIAKQNPVIIHFMKKPWTYTFISKEHYESWHNCNKQVIKLLNENFTT